jgi:hypothetical protein
MYGSMTGAWLNRWAGHWRCLVALLTLLAFLPASVLAAMPVVWCVGADGHHGIEYSIGGLGPHTVHHPRPNVAEPQDGNSTTDEGGCQDWQLMDKCRVGPQQIEGLITLDLRVAVVLPALSAPSLATATRPTQWEHGGGRPADSHLGARRSVVLRI